MRTNIFGGRRLNAYWSETSHNQYRNLISGDAVVFGGDWRSEIDNIHLLEKIRGLTVREGAVDCVQLLQGSYLKTLHTEGDSYYAGTSYLTGRQFVPRTRYHPYIASAAYGQYVAANSGGTFSGETDCDSSLVLSYAIDPKGRRAPWLDELLAPPPSPPPSAPSPPPPSPPSAPPTAPPASPFVYSGAEGHPLLAEVRVAHEAACTSVYWQTSADRCDALAVALTQRVRYVAVSPPSPPAAPDVLAPPPPSAPPSPPLPAGVTEVAVAGVVLSTLRGKYTFDEARGGVDDVVGDGYAWPPGHVVDRAAWAARPLARRVPRLGSCRRGAAFGGARGQLPRCGAQMRHAGGQRRAADARAHARDRAAAAPRLPVGPRARAPRHAGARRLALCEHRHGGGRGYRAIVYAGDGSVLNTPSFEPSAAAPTTRVLVTLRASATTRRCWRSRTPSTWSSCCPAPSARSGSSASPCTSAARRGQLPAPQRPSRRRRRRCRGPTRRRRRPAAAAAAAGARLQRRPLFAQRDARRPGDSQHHPRGLRPHARQLRTRGRGTPSLAARQRLSYYRVSDGGCCTAIVASGTTTFPTPGVLQNHETDQSGWGG